MMVLEKLMMNLKCKLRRRSLLKSKRLVYEKIDKSDSMKIEIKSRRARKLIQQTLKIADSPKIPSCNF
ncbi:hypothetical protein M9H77_15660 [Catharanthus roseus]|uniref:Uncharacterized protein n=1 Tax=Catharanthus roseus TaxID=4058 RepID=A0ACC0B0H5_CATRO|nr:hypothetical protein M9H77_15660 [Catharanthus roseus]